MRLLSPFRYGITEPSCYRGRGTKGDVGFRMTPVDHLALMSGVMANFIRMWSIDSDLQRSSERQIYQLQKAAGSRGR